METTNTLANTNVDAHGTLNGTLTNINTWHPAQRVSVKECAESVEMIYKETSMGNYTGIYPILPKEERVFKIVYSCINGKWNKSDRIYGNIIPAQDEEYKFED